MNIRRLASAMGPHSGLHVHATRIAMAGALAWALGGCGGSSSGSAVDAGGGGSTGNDASIVAGSSGGGAGGGTGGSAGGAGGSAGGAGGSVGGAGGSAGGAGGSVGGAGGTGGFFSCPSSSNTCTKAETDTYNTCLEGKCDATYKQCFGPGALMGQYSGVCGTWFTCISNCPCNGLACIIACGNSPPECQTCTDTLTTCQNNSGCTKPACYNTTPDGGTPGIKLDGGFPNFGDGGFPGFGDGGFPGFGDGGFSGFGDGGLPPGGTCADLQTCCNSITDPQTKAECQIVYDDAKGQGDSSCSPLLSGFRLAGACK